MSKTFRGELLSLGPGGVYPKNSAFEALERRRIAGEEAIQCMTRQKVLGREIQKAAAAKRRENLAERDHWVREQYCQRKSGDRNCSVEQFRNLLESDVLKISRKFRAQLRHNGQLIGVEALRRIIKAR